MTMITSEPIVKELQQLRKDLKEITGPASNRLENNLIKEHELKKLLGVGTAWLIEQRQSGKLRYAKIGRKIMYRRKDVEKFIDEHIVK